MKLRRSPHTLQVLDFFLSNPKAWKHGYDISQSTGLMSGTLYPILMRMAERGLLETCWETEHVPGRPARHLYRLTAAGREYAAAAAETAAPGPATGAPATGPVRPRWEGA